MAEKIAYMLATYFGALQLGGVRAAMLILGLIAGGLMFTGTRGNWQVVLKRNRALLGVMAMVIGWDLWYLTETDPNATGNFLAYLTLTTSSGFLPSAFAHSAKISSVVAHQSKLCLVAGGALAVVPVVRWALVTTEVSDSVGVWATCWLLSCFMGATATVMDGSVSHVGCNLGILVALASGWAGGLVNGAGLLTEAGIGGLIVTGRLCSLSENTYSRQ